MRRFIVKKGMLAGNCVSGDLRLSTVDEVQLPAAWWLLPSVLGGAAIWSMIISSLLG